MLFVAVPIRAQEPIGGTQLAVKGINADDAGTAVDNQSPNNPQPKSKELKTEKSPQKPQQEATEQKKEESPQSLEQEVKELKQEVERIRSENEARKVLEVPEEEKNKSVEEILSAVGNQYTLLKKGTIGLQYSFNYSYYSGDLYEQANSSTSIDIERRSNHNLTNTITGQYALLNNLTLNLSVPFVYKYNLVGTSSSQETTDLGDISLGFQTQPIKSGGNIPPIIFSLGLSLPTGSSAYAIDPVHSLSTGSGLYTLAGGFSVSKVVDPLVAFGNLGYTYSFPDQSLSQKWGTSATLTGVQPGSSIGLAFGFGYALSYQASMNMSVQMSYAFNTKYTLNNYDTYETGSTLSSTFNVGTGWRLTATRSIYVTLGIGLTVNDPDLSLTFTLPFEF
ncbi:MAG: transporter [Smithella sp.]